MNAITPYRDAVLIHPVYAAMTSIERVRVFMESHVFAIWDLMSLFMRMLVELCGDDDAKWNGCVHVVRTALTARAALWTAVAGGFQQV